MTFSPITRFNSLRVRHNQLSPLSTKVAISYFHPSAESSIDICQRTILDDTKGELKTALLCVCRTSRQVQPWFAVEYRLSDTRDVDAQSLGQRVPDFLQLIEVRIGRHTPVPTVVVAKHVPSKPAFEI